MTYVVKKIKDQVINKIPGVDFLQREVIDPLKKAAPILSYPEKFIENTANVVQKDIADPVNKLFQSPAKDMLAKTQQSVQNSLAPTAPTAAPTAPEVVQQAAADTATGSAAARAAAKRRAAALALARGGRASTILSQGSEVIPAVGLGSKGTTLG